MTSATWRKSGTDGSLETNEFDQAVTESGRRVFRRTRFRVVPSEDGFWALDMIGPGRMWSRVRTGLGSDIEAIAAFNRLANAGQFGRLDAVEVGMGSGTKKNGRAKGPLGLSDAAIRLLRRVSKSGGLRMGEYDVRHMTQLARRGLVTDRDPTGITAKGREFLTRSTPLSNPSHASLQGGALFVNPKRRNPSPTYDAILAILRRRPELSLTELAHALPDASSKDLRHALNRLEHAGMGFEQDGVVYSLLTNPSHGSKRRRSTRNPNRAEHERRATRQQTLLAASTTASARDYHRGARDAHRGVAAANPGKPLSRRKFTMDGDGPWTFRTIAASNRDEGEYLVRELRELLEPVPVGGHATYYGGAGGNIVFVRVA